MTDAEMLAKVEAAIDFTLTGNVESYQIAGRMTTRLSIESLYKMRKELRANVARAVRGSICVVAGMRSAR